MGELFDVNIAWRTLEQLHHDACALPNWLETEADYQAELYRRLANAFHALGLAYYDAAYDYGSGVRRYTFSRLGANHGVRNGNGDRRCPDLVIYDNLGKNQSPPEDDYGWPIALAFEIKYNRPSADVDADVVKLRHLLKRKGMRYGCAISVERCRAERAGLSWVHHPRLKDRLFTAHLRVPRPYTDRAANPSS